MNFTHFNSIIKFNTYSYNIIYYILYCTLPIYLVERLWIHLGRLGKEIIDIPTFFSYNIEKNYDLHILYHKYTNNLGHKFSYFWKKWFELICFLTLKTTVTSDSDAWIYLRSYGRNIWLFENCICKL